MSQRRPIEIEDYRKLQEQIFGGGRKWIVALDVAASTTGYIEGLRNRGAGPCLGIGASRGTGELPQAEWGGEPIVLDVQADSMMEGIWASQAALADLPDWALERIEAFDPDREARVVGTIFDDGKPVGGRPKFGARQPEWRRLEDKTIVDAIWSELGVPHAPFEIVEMNRGALGAASQRLDRGYGVVWAGDARSGFHGGAEFTRWIRDDEHADDTFARFERFCDSARVMPFLEGIPCSIHGIVFPDWVIAGRPCEMLVLRQENLPTFRYATAATFWDPPDAERDSMRQLAKRVGDHLRDSVGFRGAFTIDGVMTEEGFRPTELNPRFGGALGMLVSNLGLGITYIDLALMEGVEVDWNPQHLENVIVDHADANRCGRSNMIVSGVEVGSDKLGIRRVDGALAWCDYDDEDAVVRVFYGPAAAGTYFGLRYNPAQMPTGPSAAVVAADVINFLNDEMELGIARVTAAPDVL